MKDWQNIIVLAGAVVFMIFLLWRMRPVRRGAVQVGDLARHTLQARLKARDATSPRQRAQVLCDAAVQLAKQRSSRFAALTLFLRALHADPTWPEPIEHLRKLLWFARPRALERILWTRLARASWHDEQRAVALAAAQSLAELYRARLRERSRAVVLDRVAASLRAEPSQPGTAA
jgi:hypothetical protein